MADDIEFKSKIFTTFSNPIRRQILELIAEEGEVTYTQLTNEFNLKSGPLYHHLRVIGQFVHQTEDKKYRLTEEGKIAVATLLGDDTEQIKDDRIVMYTKPNVFSIGKFSLVPFVRFFSKNYAHTLIEFIILAGFSVFIGVGNKILIVGNFVISYEVPLWLGYVSLIASWLFLGIFSEIFSRILGRKMKPFALISVISLVFLPSFIFILITGVVGWISGVTVVVPSIVLLILHGIFQIWSFLVLITAIGELKELSIEKSSIIAMAGSYIQIFVLIFVLL
ncbi:MAG: winged helix-turn-helix domain-containing protein [Candidatus Heimdallarchaeaceae archaeon]|jgi:DNA-binding transcriptional ArsR family regulator